MNEGERKLALFDVDGTLLDGFLIFPIIEQQAKDGLIENRDYQRIRRVRQRYVTGQLAYGAMVVQVLELHAKALEGKSFFDLQQHSAQYLKDNPNTFHDSSGRVMRMLEPTHDRYLVTAEPQFMAEAVSDSFEADGCTATTYQTEGEKFTGQVESILSSTSKGLVVADYLLRYPHEGSFAFGDTEGDIGMLSVVENAVCINPSADLRKEAERNNWLITTPTLLVRDVAVRLMQ